MVLVPSTMSLLGKANWWLPRWLDRMLPHMDLEGGDFGQHTPEPELQPIEVTAVEVDDEDDSERELELV